MQAYEGRFESVFVVLHPFIRVPQQLAWSTTHRYPNDAQLASHGVPCTWAEVASETGLGSAAHVSQTLLTAIGVLPDYLADLPARDTLQRYLEIHPVWMPTEGRFEPLLQPAFLQVFRMAGYEELIYVPEFPQSDPIVHLSIAELRHGAMPFPSCGTLLAPDMSFLFTVDWDSFFTLFYGERAFVSAAARALHLEGFFASPNTEHAWFNYNLGCATVTVSPEDWSQL